MCFTKTREWVKTEYNSGEGMGIPKVTVKADSGTKARRECKKGGLPLEKDEINVPWCGWIYGEEVSASGQKTNKEIMAEIIATMTKIIKPRIHKTNLKYDYLKDCTGTCNNQISENQ